MARRFLFDVFNLHFFLKNEVEKAIKEMWDQMAAADDGVPGDVLKLLKKTVSK
jgi:hypothetical protein